MSLDFLREVNSERSNGNNIRVIRITISPDVPSQIVITNRDDNLKKL